MISQKFGVGLDSLTLNAGVVDYEETRMKEPCQEKQLEVKMRVPLCTGNVQSLIFNRGGAWCGLLSLCGILCFLPKYGLSSTQLLNIVNLNKKINNWGLHFNFSPTQSGNRGADIIGRCPYAEALKHVLRNTFIIFLSQLQNPNSEAKVVKVFS